MSAVRWMFVVVVAAAAAVFAIGPACAATNAFGVGSEGEGEGETESATRQPPGLCPTEPCSQDALDVCVELVARSCGACADSAGCEAASLLARHEPERCADALADERRFPPCVASACDALMTRVCGGAPPSPSCANHPACGPASVLHARATGAGRGADDIARAEASCAAALTDEQLFSPCDP
jgi:hypothetical protein